MMKKILSVFTILSSILIASASNMVVSCGVKPVNDLNQITPLVLDDTDFFNENTTINLYEWNKNEVLYDSDFDHYLWYFYYFVSTAFFNAMKNNEYAANILSSRYYDVALIWILSQEEFGPIIEMRYEWKTDTTKNKDNFYKKYFVGENTINFNISYNLANSLTNTSKIYNQIPEIQEALHEINGLETTKFFNISGISVKYVIGRR